MAQQFVLRTLNLTKLLNEHTVFLFGPRQTGKSTYVREQLGKKIKLTFNLLDRSLLLRLITNPAELRQEIEARNLRNVIVCIDEIQKCPDLLDEVQLLIEERHIRFLLTGSSARKLKRAGTNLLGGRGRDRRLHPFTYNEVKNYNFKLERAMNYGLIPGHYFASDPDDALESYVTRYLTEEIAAEGISRNISAFARFLQVAATINTQLINATSISSDAQVSRQTIQNYIQILRDTLLGYDLLPFGKTVKRKPIVTPKFYFFDMGVVRTLRRLPPITPANAEYGEFFEHFIFLELRAYIDYNSPRTLLHYWRSTSGFEVDFIYDERVAIEAKASKHITEKHLKGLRALAEEHQLKRFIVVCHETRPRLVDGIYIMPWRMFLDELWTNRLTNG
ncbi:MAG: ATP-binding protein [Deltaproteobacteria bacterium]|nr:ATP-binding protein [Deltaproteobacteria bacterium]